MLFAQIETNTVVGILLFAQFDEGLHHERLAQVALALGSVLEAQGVRKAWLLLFAPLRRLATFIRRLQYH